MLKTEKTAPERSGAAPPATTAMVVFAPDPGLCGRILVIAPGLTVGRVGGAELDLAVDDPRMSRRHARFRLHAEGLQVEDQGSTNGTWVDGRRIAGATALAAGSIVRAGNTLLEIGEAAAEDPLAPPLGPDLVGRAPAFLAAVRQLERVAQSDLSLILRGETGTGKELLAAHAHRLSRRSGPFVTVNCAAIPRELLESTMFGHRKGAFTGAVADAPGHFARADGGTLFLDEIGDMSLELQAKLLRVLESGEFTPVGQAEARRSDVRVVCATHADLLSLVETGGFRRDLYARLAGFVIELPPLRRRRGDVALLATHFLAGAGRAGLRTSADFLEPLLVAPWPMNVRELRTAMRRVALLVDDGQVLTAAHARSALGAAVAPPAAEATTSSEPPAREELEALLAQSGGNIAQVAAHYGKDRRQAYRWLKRYGIDPGAYR